MSQSSLTAEAIQSFITRKVAGLAKLKPEEVDVTKTYDYYGLSSMESVLLIADVEEFLGRSLDATLLWDYPTIQSLSNFLADHN